MTQDCLRKARVEPLKKMVIDVLPFPLSAVLVAGWFFMGVGALSTPWLTIAAGLLTLPLNGIALHKVLANADDSPDLIMDWMITLMSAGVFIWSLIRVVT